MNKLLVIVGATATGKTKLALDISKKYDSEIVSADSRQLYEFLDIGTGKGINDSNFKIIKGNKLWNINNTPIHLYDVIKPNKTYSVAKYQQAAYKTIDSILKRKKIPILVGGTGLYIRAVSDGINIPKNPPSKLLRKKLSSKPTEILLSELKALDQITFNKIDRANRRRIIRALEVYYQSGIPFSKLKEQYSPRFDVLKIGLTGKREKLYQRADSQVDSWFLNDKFPNEVKNILSMGYQKNAPAMTSLGYRQVILFLEGKIALEEAIQKIKWDQHSYIRRQLTWFRKDPDIHWFDISMKGFEKNILKKIEEWKSSL